MLRLTTGIIFWAMLASVAYGRMRPCPSDSSVEWTDCFGSYIWPGGEQYVGEWHGNQRDGQGTNVYPNGNKYTGQFYNNEKSGQGTLYAANGSVLQSGTWSNGQYVETAVSSPKPQHTQGNEIALVKEGGTFKVPVLINGVIVLHFTVDSGAADVSVPADVVLTLMRTGTLRPNDFLGTQTYRLADGSTVPSKTFRIRSLKVGGKVIENVTGSMANIEGSLLLGQSFLSRFGRISFDYNRQVLVME